MQVTSQDMGHKCQPSHHQTQSHLTTFCKRLLPKPCFHLECPVKFCQGLSCLRRLSYGDRPHLGEASWRRVERASGAQQGNREVTWFPRLCGLNVCLLSFRNQVLPSVSMSLVRGQELSHNIWTDDDMGGAEGILRSWDGRLQRV